MVIKVKKLYNHTVVKKRFEHIDFLRSVAIVGVVAIHTLSYNLTNSINYQVWNYLNFVVVSFVFCSGYVLIAIYSDRLNSLSAIFSWYKKRLSHLLIPFYVYLLVHYMLWILFPNFFSGLGLQKNAEFIFRSLTLTGGANLNWLTLLFLELTLLFPILVYISKSKLWTVYYAIISITVTIIITVLRFPYEYYRGIMWLPWSTILLISIFFFFKEETDSNVRAHTKRYLFSGILAAIIFSTLVWSHFVFQKSFQLVDYKYPPDLYYLSYGFFVTTIILILGEELKIHHSHMVKMVIRYISKHSYSLFFIHFIMLDFVITITDHQGVWSHPFVQFIIVLSASLVVCWLVVDAKNYATKKRG